MKEREFLGYNLFTHINNEKLRVWNRANVYVNILEVKGKATADKYLAQVGKEEEKKVRDLFKTLLARGYDSVYKEVRATI